MDGAVLVYNCSGVTFHAELCIPWDAPRVVIDERSTITFGSVTRPHRADRDSRVVQFRRPELHSANKEYGDGEAREPRTSAFMIDISAGKPTLVTEVQLPKYTVSEGNCRGELGAGLRAGSVGTGVGRELRRPDMVQFVRAGTQGRRATRSTIAICV